MSSSAKSTPQATAESIVTLLEERGQGDYIGESISQLEHCLQCAHQGLQAGRSSTTIIAALLHDIGQFLPIDAASELKMSIGGHSSVGRIGHERIGEEYLRSLGFSNDVCRLVGSHVAAKRYLTAVDSAYYDSLSEASKASLGFQGGPFEGEQLVEFERDPLREEMVMLRRWDDKAKVVGIVDVTPRAGTYVEMIARHLSDERHDGRNESS